MDQLLLLAIQLWSPAQVNDPMPGQGPQAGLSWRLGRREENTERPGRAMQVITGF